MANMVSMLEAHRTDRVFAQGGSTATVRSSMMASMSMAGGGQGGGMPDWVGVLVKETQLNRALQKEVASRPISIDYLAQERQEQYVQHIRNIVCVSSK